MLEFWRYGNTWGRISEADFKTLHAGDNDMLFVAFYFSDDEKSQEHVTFTGLLERQAGELQEQVSWFDGTTPLDLRRTPAARIEAEALILHTVDTRWVELAVESPPFDTPRSLQVSRNMFIIVSEMPRTPHTDPLAFTAHPSWQSPGVW